MLNCTSVLVKRLLNFNFIQWQKCYLNWIIKMCTYKICFRFNFSERAAVQVSNTLTIFLFISSSMASQILFIYHFTKRSAAYASFSFWKSFQTTTISNRKKNSTISDNVVVTLCDSKHHIAGNWKSYVRVQNTNYFHFYLFVKYC